MFTVLHLAEADNFVSKLIVFMKSFVSEAAQFERPRYVFVLSPFIIVLI